MHERILTATRWLIAGGALSLAAWWFLVPADAAAPKGQKPPPKAEAEEEAPPEKERYLSRQKLDKGVTLARMSNGMTVVVQENHAAPVATVRSYIHNTGSAYEGKFLGDGLSHLLEHLVAGGTTTKRSEEEIRKIMDTLGGQTNAYTSDDVTAFYIDCPAKGVMTAINLIAENMQFSVIPEKEYRREMGVVMRELEMGESERSRVLHNSMKKLIYFENPTRHPTIGYSSLVSKVDRQEVIDFYKDRYVPENMLFVVTGDVDTDKVLDAVLENFENFARTAERQVILPEEPPQASPRSMRMEMEGPSVHFCIGWPTVRLQHPDLYPLDVASFILTNGDSSRLTRRLKIERPLVNSISSASYTPGFVKGWFQVVVECEPANVQLVSDIIMEEIERLQSQPVSAEELAKAKRQKAAEHVFNQQTVQNQAEILASSYLSTGDPLFDEQYVAGIQKVTPQEIQDVARRYFRPESQNTVLIEPLGSKQQQLEQTATQAPESPFVLKTLPNGLKVLLKRNPIIPLVSLQVYARAGSVSDTPETSGLASLASSLMEKGTKKYSGEQIADYFDGVGGTFAVSSQRNTTFLQSTVLKENFDESLDYAYQVLFQPTFSEEEFAKLQKLQLNRIAARTANPQTEILDFWSEELPASSPYHRSVLGEKKTVEKLTVADCRAFHSKFFVPSNLVLAVVGDIDVDKTFARLEKLFGAVPRGKAIDWPKYGDNPPLAANEVKHLTNQKQNTAMVVMGYPIVSIYDHKMRATLELLEAMLTGGGGAGGRLHEELRGERLVYYVFGIQITGYAPGYFLFMAQTRPETLNEVVSRIEANLKQIAEKGIPSDEFAKAKVMLAAAHALRNTTASEQASQAAIDELYGLGFDYEKGYDERIAKVTLEEVVAAVKKYFQHAVIATSAPAASEEKPAGAAVEK